MGGANVYNTDYVSQAHVMISQPHVHEFPQYLNFYSANPKDAHDFDAEIEVTIEGKSTLSSSLIRLHSRRNASRPGGFCQDKQADSLYRYRFIRDYSRVGNTPD